MVHCNVLLQNTFDHSFMQESCAVSDNARRMEGTLSVQLLAMQSIKVGKRMRWSGPVQVVLQCETLGDGHTCTLPRLQVAGGQAAFRDSGTLSATTGTHEDSPSDFVFRKVPMSGVLTLTLRRISLFGLKTMAKAYLHLDQAQHQEDGGRDVEHTLKWHPVSGADDSMGSLTLNAFWMSTEQERLEMELMAVQVCKFELVQVNVVVPREPYSVCFTVYMFLRSVTCRRACSGRASEEVRATCAARREIWRRHDW